MGEDVGFVDVWRRKDYFAVPITTASTKLCMDHHCIAIICSVLLYIKHSYRLNFLEPGMFSLKKGGVWFG